MSKIATYLNEHVAGEVLADTLSLERAARDGSIVLQTPEVLVHAANTSDIRKIMRFCWQLAEKGHALPVIARGHGTSSTGNAVGRGIILDQTKYRNSVIELDAKQQLVHVAGGATLDVANAALSSYGLRLPSASPSGRSSGTVAGAIADRASGLDVHKTGGIGAVVQKLEVVLANGDVLQTGRIAKKEVNRRKGLQTREGDIYRQLDNLISDNQELLDQLDDATSEHSPYGALAKVKQRDGSFDLTPLFVGSQGAFGIISEAILKADFVSHSRALVIATFSSMNDAQSAAELAQKSKASVVELIDGRIFADALRQGKRYEWLTKEVLTGAVLLVTFDDFSERQRQRQLKRLVKKLEPSALGVHEVADGTEQDVVALHSAIELASHPISRPRMMMPQVFSGIWVPAVRLDGFLADVRALEMKMSINLPVRVDMQSNNVDFYPVFDAGAVSDRQRIMKLLKELALLVKKHEGSLVGRGGAGQLKGVVIDNVVDAEVLELQEKVRTIFDPRGILNPSAVAPASRTLVSRINDWCRN